MKMNENEYSVFSIIISILIQFFKASCANINITIKIVHCIQKNQ